MSGGCTSGRPLPNLTDADRARFESFVDRSGGPDSCHLWTGARNWKGYGRFKANGRALKAHRVALAIAGVELAPGQLALHSCDRPLCVNAAHLRAGSHRENMRDAIARGRIARGDRHGFRLHPERRPRGDRHGRAKLTAETVLDARARHAAGESIRSIARALGVDRNTAREAIRGTTWAHVTEAPPVANHSNHNEEEFTDELHTPRAP